MVPGGKLANAASVGANTVNGPLLLSVATRSAAVSAMTNVLNRPSLTAVMPDAKVLAQMSRPVVFQQKVLEI